MTSLHLPYLGVFSKLRDGNISFIKTNASFCRKAVEKIIRRTESVEQFTSTHRIGAEERKSIPYNFYSDVSNRIYF